MRPRFGHFAMVFLVVLAAAWARGPASAQPVCGGDEAQNKDETQNKGASPNQINVTIDFNQYRVPSILSCKANRDIEFLWSSNYQTMFGVSPIGGTPPNDIDQFGITLAETFKNPFNFPMSDIQLIHDYEVLRRTFRDSVYRVCPDPNGFRVLQSSYPDAERNHVDTYLYVPKYGSYAGDDPSNYGRWPASSIFTPDPDEDPGAELNLNSISVAGPKPNEIGVPGANAWYRPDGPVNSTWVHEFQHDLNAFGGAYGEMYSSIAQSISGAAVNQANPYDVPYTSSLLSTSGFGSFNNYYAWEALGAYVAFNFRGSDTTFAGRSDDLLWRWTMAAGNGSPSLTNLGQQLVDSRCAECAPKFPAGVTAAKDRREVLVHNWRVYNYVDNPGLAQGQYGIPGNFGPSPSRRLHFWKDNDGCCFDNPIAMPPETTLTSAASSVTVTSSRTVTCSGPPDPCGSLPPLAVTALDEYGAEYWIVRSDASLNQAGNNLVIRVEPTAIPPLGKADRLMVSVIGYSNTSENGVRTLLWTKPQWAQSVVGPQWIDVRTQACSPIELTLPNFGTTNKAAVVVITLGSSGDNEAFQYTAVQPFKLTMSVKPGATCTPPAATALMTSPTVSDERGAFSPAGNEVVFTHYTPGAGDGRIYRKLLDGSPATQLVAGTPAGPQASPDWSPRGDKVVYEQDTPGGDTHLWLYSLGGAAIQLTNSTRYEAFPAFSPNGQQIAYMHGIGYGSSVWELRRVALDGSSNTLVYACNYGLSWPRWSPDGSKIYFVRGDSLYAVNSNGGQPVFVPKVKPTFRSFDLPLGKGPFLTDDTGLLCTGTHLALQDTVAQTRTYPFEQPGKELTHGRWAYDGIRAIYGARQVGGDVDLYVGASNCNHAPVLNGISKADVEELPLCIQYQRVLGAVDSDGDPITYQAAYLPPGATFTGGNRFRWTPSAGQALQTFYVVFRALDNKGGVDNVVVKMTTSDWCEIQCPPGHQCYPESGDQEIAELPAAFALMQNSPNPFDERTRIAFDLPQAVNVRVDVFDIQGRLVRRLVDRPYEAGRWSTTWDRRDASGNKVSLGVYFYRARMGSYLSEKKMMVLR